MSAQNPPESAASIDASPSPAPVDPATIPGPYAANLGPCARCGTDDDTCCITIGGGGPHCCAECRNTAGRSHPNPEGVGTGAGEGAPRQDTGSAWVTRSADCPEAPAQAHPLAPTANLGDGANGRLSEAVRSVLAEAFAREMYERVMEATADQWRRWPFLTDTAKEAYRVEAAEVMTDALGHAFAAIVREHTERAWDEGWNARVAYEDTPFDGFLMNPYRAAREEQNRG